MISSKSTPKPGEGSNAWLIKILTGLLVILILGIHFIVNHITGGLNGLMTYNEIVSYYARNPIIPIMEGLFVTVVVTHSLLGLRSVLLDLKLSRKTLSTVNWLFLLGGAAFIIYGIGLIVVIVIRGSQV